MEFLFFVFCQLGFSFKLQKTPLHSVLVWTDQDQSTGPL